MSFSSNIVKSESRGKIILTKAQQGSSFRCGCASMSFPEPFAVTGSVEDCQEQEDEAGLAVDSAYRGMSVE